MIRVLIVDDSAFVRQALQRMLRDDPGIEVVGAARDGQQLDVTVRDDGAGFDPAYANKLFRPFQRQLDPDEFSGEGIGLASVKRIIERHGGTITGEGAPGQGARFRFTLPEEPG